MKKQSVIYELKDQKFFDFLTAMTNDEVDFEKDDETYKFCFSFALSRNLSPSKLPNKDKTTRWAIGSFDADGEILLAINSLFPDIDSPIDILASHAEAGIQEISRN